MVSAVLAVHAAVALVVLVIAAARTGDAV